MSIFKESFKPFVKNQISQRQTKVGQNNRNYFIQRQCTIRLASAVNIGNSSLTAKQNVLEGGIKNVTSTTTDGVTTNKFSNKSGFGGAYDGPSGGFGYVPMPGITSVNIKTKTAYGSLRTATVKFECHSTKQLSLLEKLYMRPGYQCLLEWGWEPYINNDGSIENNLSFISNNNNFWTKNGYTQKQLYENIIKNKKDSFGNYDGFFGAIQDFDYSVRPDGGYSCTTILISMGEVLESLLGEVSDVNLVEHSLEKTLDDLNEYAYQVSYESDYEAASDILEEELKEQDFDISIEGIQEELAFIEDFNTERTFTAAARAKQLTANFGITKKDIIVNKSDLGDSTPTSWLRWGALLKVINNSIPKDAKEQKIAELAIGNDDLEFNLNSISSEIATAVSNALGPFKSTSQGGSPFGTQGPGTFSSQQQFIFSTSYIDTENALNISTNPKVCVFPYNLFLLDAIPTNSKGDKIFTKNNRKISNIYFEIDYLTRVFKSQFYKKDEFGNNVANENFSLGKYIKKIWDDVNESCGKGHNFQLQVNHEKTNIARIVDLEYESLKVDNLVQLSVLSKNSIVRDFSYNLSIPSSLTSTIAVGAQNPDSPRDLESVTFAAFNKGIKNRFFLSEDKNRENERQNRYNLVRDIQRLERYLLEIRVFLERLKSQNEASDIIFNKVEYYNSLLEGNSGRKNQKQQLLIQGEYYEDYDNIPSSDLTKAKVALKESILLSRNLKLFDIKTGNPKNITPDVTSIIPLKYNAKLDGISGIIIGNVFNIEKSKLPESYKDNKVGFIVTGEEQQIDGQDWTTTITGQAVILPI